MIQATCQAAIHHHNRVEILTNGAQFYPAMRDAILDGGSVGQPRGLHLPARRRRRHADRRDGRRAHAPASRCGWCSTRSAAAAHERRPARRLREAGCQVEFYQPITWYRLHRLNNRTHRELLVVDGRVAFTGGAGVADWWLQAGRRRGPRGATRWRASKGRSSRRCRGSSPRTGSSAAARS